jgi:hypothetical protein
MMLHKNLIFCLCLALLVLAPGCDKKDEQANETGPTLEQIQADANEMDVEQLLAGAQKDKDELLAGKAKVDQFVMKLQNLTSAEKAAGEAQRINVELGELQRSMQVSKARFVAYYTKLKEQGVDVSDLER